LALFSVGSGVVQAGDKKGACVSQGGGADYRSKVEQLNVSWHYSWGSDLLQVPAGVEFVPMIWSVKTDRESQERFSLQIDGLKAARVRQDGPTTLLGFNEPDRKAQASMSVQWALDLWPRLEETGLRLGSPSPKTDGNWMRAFMTGVDERGYRVDFVCVHWYGGSNVDGFIDALMAYHALYRKPIWITEFACADWRAESLAENRLTAVKVQAFLREALPRLDALDFVERYAWFSFDADSRFGGPSALFDKDGQLTPLGEIYAEHP
jgi:hypothetical protein